MSVFDEAPVSITERLVAAKLAAAPSVAGFFGTTRISVLTLAEADNPIREPFLAVIHGALEGQRVIGGDVVARVPILVRAYLPFPTPASQSVARPIAPVVATGAAGNVSGTVSYRLTRIGAAGESFASPASPAVTVTNKAPVLTLPGTDGYRVWRTPDGLSRHHFAGLAADGATTWTDPGEALGDELAPCLGDDSPDALMFAVAAVLYGSEALPDTGGDETADESLVVVHRLPQLITRRNLMAWDLEASYPTIYNPTTNVITVGA